MIRTIHLTHRFEKQLDAMRRSHKMAVAASRKADAVINRLLENGQSPLYEVGKFSRHGECRIRNAVKFDIGKGYRMLGIKEKEDLFLVFVGPHDDCSAWVENNRGLDNVNSRKRIRTLETGTPQPTDTALPMDAAEPDYDDLLLARITEQDLSIVFSGLKKTGQG